MTRPDTNMIAQDCFFVLAYIFFAAMLIGIQKVEEGKWKHSTVGWLCVGFFIFVMGALAK